MDGVDIVSLRLDGAINGNVRKPLNMRWMKVRFLKGPIALNWLAAAAKLPGKALHVAVAIRYLEGLTKSSVVKLTSATLRIFGVERKAGYRALSKMQEAGLVSTVRRVGASPIVTIIEMEAGG